LSVSVFRPEWEQGFQGSVLPQALRKKRDEKAGPICRPRGDRSQASPRGRAGRPVPPRSTVPMFHENGERRISTIWLRAPFALRKKQNPGSGNTGQKEDRSRPCPDVWIPKRKHRPAERVGSLPPSRPVGPFTNKKLNGAAQVGRFVPCGQEDRGLAHQKPSNQRTRESLPNRLERKQSRAVNRSPGLL